MSNILNTLGFDERTLEEYGKKLTEENNQRTKILCSKCGAHLFNFVGSINFQGKALRMDDIEVISKQKKSEMFCYMCGTPWLHIIIIQGVRSGHLLSDKGWIPKINK